MLHTNTIDSFNIVVRNLSRQPYFSIQTRGSRKVAIVRKKEIAVYHTSKSNSLDDRKRAKKIMSETRAAITRYIRKNLATIPMIRKDYPPLYTNKVLWPMLPVNTEFYLIDAKHCYWRIAFILGYISRNLYLKYCNDKEFKTLRNISLAILNTGIKREYYLNGEKTHDVSCDVSLYQQIYTNIRHYAYNNSGKIKTITDDFCIGYRIDGLFLLKPALRTAKEIFRKNKLLFEIRTCTKIDEKNYATKDGELKKMV